MCTMNSKVSSARLLALIFLLLRTIAADAAWIQMLAPTKTKDPADIPTFARRHRSKLSTHNSSNDNISTAKSEKPHDPSESSPKQASPQKIIASVDADIDGERDPSTMSNEELMLAIGTSPRRILLSFISATGIALAANFLGVTSRLLELAPESTVEQTGLDTYYPRGDYKRVKGDGYTFLIPKEWVADTAIELAKAQRRAQTLDYSIKRSSGGKVLPDAAFGPPGRLDSRGVSNVDTNVSVVVSKVPTGFSLRGSLGTPENAAETYLRVSLAPEGSGRTATLVNAEEDLDRGVYRFEYTVDRGENAPPLRAISIIGERSGDTLITATVVSPLEMWNDATFDAKLRKIATTFRLSR